MLSKPQIIRLGQHASKHTICYFLSLQTQNPAMNFNDSLYSSRSCCVRNHVWHQNEWVGLLQFWKDLFIHSKYTFRSTCLMYLVLIYFWLKFSRRKWKFFPSPYHRLCYSFDKLHVLWSNQQMHLYAVNFIPLLGSLYMFRVFCTPIIKSTIFNCIYSHWYKP